MPIKSPASELCCTGHGEQFSTERCRHARWDYPMPNGGTRRKSLSCSSTILPFVFLEVRFRTTPYLPRVECLDRYFCSLKRRCHPCTVLKGGSVCIARRCRVVFTRNCESDCLSAPCLNWFEVRHRQSPCTEGFISIYGWPQIGWRVGDA